MVHSNMQEKADIVNLFGWSLQSNSFNGKRNWFQFNFNLNLIEFSSRSGWHLSLYQSTLDFPKMSMLGQEILEKKAAVILTIECLIQSVFRRSTKIFLRKGIRILRKILSCLPPWRKRSRSPKYVQCMEGQGQPSIPRLLKLLWL